MYTIINFDSKQEDLITRLLCDESLMMKGGGEEEEKENIKIQLV